MKHKNFSKLILSLSCTLLGIIVLSVVYFCSANLENGDTDKNSMQKQKHLKEIELMEALNNYNKDNIEEVIVHVETSEHEIISANIFILSKNIVADTEEQNNIMAVASGCLNLNSQSIDIKYYEDKETFSTHGTKDTGN